MQNNYKKLLCDCAAQFSTHDHYVKVYFFAGNTYFKSDFSKLNVISPKMSVIPKIKTNNYSAFHFVLMITNADGLI